MLDTIAQLWYWKICNVKSRINYPEFRLSDGFKGTSNNTDDQSFYALSIQGEAWTLTSPETHETPLFFQKNLDMSEWVFSKVCMENESETF